MMRGPLIQTEARTILNRGISQGISENKKETALKMLKMGKLSLGEIAEYSALVWLKLSNSQNCIPYKRDNN